MPYTPLNLQIYNAAYTGAMGGMFASTRLDTNPSPTTAGKVLMASQAGAFAQAVDAAWAAASGPIADLLNVYAIKEASEAEWEIRGVPTAIQSYGGPPGNAGVLIPAPIAATYAPLAASLVAMVFAAETYFASQGIIPPPVSGSGTTLTTTAVTTATYAASLTDTVILCNRAGPISVTLPVVTPGRTLWIKDISGAAATNNITVIPQSGTIDKSSTYVLNLNYAGIHLVCDGTNWWVIAAYTGTTV